MTQIEQALTDVKAVGFDTAPLIYFIEKHPDYVDTMREIIRRVDSGLVLGYSSVITLTEILTKPIQMDQAILEREYRSLLLDSQNFTLIFIDISIAERAAQLRAQYNLSTPDALQIAAALSAECQAFVTNDHQLKRVTDLSIIVLDDLVNATTSTPSS